MGNGIHKREKLYVWGYNGNGQLGIGNTSNQSSPQEVTTQTFDGSGVEKLKKFKVLLVLQMVICAILTERGTIYTLVQMAARLDGKW